MVPLLVVCTVISITAISGLVLLSSTTESIISNSTSRSLSSRLVMAEFSASNKRYHKWARRLGRKSNRRRLVRASLLAGNVCLLVAVVFFIMHSPHDTTAVSPAVLHDSSTDTAIANPLDQVASSSVALSIARMDNLPETTAIYDQAISDTTELTMPAATNSVISKPQVVATSFKSNKDIKTYVTVSGDTIPGIADKFGITSDSIRWSNNISGDAIGVGVKLLIPPVTGIVYTVQPGDTPDTLAAKYNADRNKIVAYNDAEISGLSVGEQILIPDASKVASVSKNTKSNVGAILGWGGAASYGYNGYDFGYCTWWVAKLRGSAGNPVPSNLGNASTWAVRAAQFGLPVGSTPRVGAAVVLSTRGAGHVAYVTAVNSDGSITVSEMNHEGWDRTDTRTLPNDGYRYVY